MTPERHAKLMRFQNAVFEEYQRARSKHSIPMRSKHEGFAILKEEVDEMWDAIRKDEPEANVEHEAIQVGAMVLSYLVEVIGMQTGNTGRERE